MSLRGAVTVLLLVGMGVAFGQLPSLSPVPPSTPGPVVEWVGCGPSYNGHQVGVSCGMEAALSQALTAQGLFSWSAVDFTFYKGKPSDTTSTGLVLDVRHFSLGKVVVRVNLIGAPGVTTTTTATLGSFTYGLHPVIEWKGLTVGGGFRGATGGTTPRLWNVAVGWRFGR